MTKELPPLAYPPYLPAEKLAGLSLDQLAQQYRAFCAFQSWTPSVSLMAFTALASLPGSKFNITGVQSVWIKAFITQWDAERLSEQADPDEVWSVMGCDGLDSTELFQSTSQSEACAWAKGYTARGDFGGWGVIMVCDAQGNNALTLEAEEATPDDDEGEYEASDDNERRCANAQRAIDAAYPLEDDLADMVADLLTDLRHLCRREGVSFKDANSDAAINFAAETDSPDGIELADHPIFAGEAA